MICLKKCDNKTEANYCKTSTCIYPEKWTQQENKQLKEIVGCTTEKCIFKDKIEHYENIDFSKYDKLEEELEARAEVIKRQAHELTQLQQDNKKLQKEITYQNIVFAQFQQTKNINIFLQQEKEDLIKWFQDNLKALENMPFAISKSAVIKEFEEGLSKLKGDDKEC